ncbi:MAG: site-specific integrase [Candidatus Thiodiazotropha endolucinida]|nr:site-specific integrase [Candidatus Thiodiazotropha taylori]MCW4268098.1 site-specific integrase [Candidatus Thiodiazotropha endolucinida]
MARERKVVLNQPTQPEGRVGTRRSTQCIETYLRRAYDLFGGGKVGKDIVGLLEIFFTFKVGRDGNKSDSAKQAILAICDFLEFNQTPPWKWTPHHLYDYLTHLHTDKGLSGKTIRSRHHYVKHMCDSILSDRDIANKIERKYPGASFQQITNETSRLMVRGVAKRKRKLANPSPSELQQVFDYLESEIREAIETGQPTPYVLFRDRALVAMLYAYGLRLNEMVQANVTDFEYSPECPEYGDYGLLHVVGKGDKYRVLPITVDWIHAVMSQYIEQVRPHWTHDPRTPENDKDALFFSNNRKRISKTAIQRIVKERFHEAGVKKSISPHRLRNACLTRITDEIGLSEASKFAGHSFAHTTEGYYSSKASVAGDPLGNYVQNIYRKQNHND